MKKCCDNCANCIPHNPFIPVCGECAFVLTADGKIPSNWKPFPMTNADRIRAMTDEELEAFLIDVDLDKAGSPFINEWGKWLKQPAEEDA